MTLVDIKTRDNQTFKVEAWDNLDFKPEWKNQKFQVFVLFFTPTGYRPGARKDTNILLRNEDDKFFRFEIRNQDLLDYVLDYGLSKMLLNVSDIDKTNPKNTDQISLCFIPGTTFQLVKQGRYTNVLSDATTKLVNQKIPLEIGKLYYNTYSIAYYLGTLQSNKKILLCQTNTNGEVVKVWTQKSFKANGIFNNNRIAMDSNDVVDILTNAEKTIQNNRYSSSWAYSQSIKNIKEALKDTIMH